MRVGPEQALLGQRRQPGDDAQASVVGRRADRLGRLQVEAADEDAQPREQPPLGWSQQVIAPGQRRPQRLLAGRQIAPTGRQHRQSLREPGQQLGRGEQIDAGGRQLDRQRQAVQPGADTGDRRDVVGRQREIDFCAERARATNNSTAG